MNCVKSWNLEMPCKQEVAITQVKCDLLTVTLYFHLVIDNEESNVNIQKCRVTSPLMKIEPRKHWK